MYYNFGDIRKNNIEYILTYPKKWGIINSRSKRVCSEIEKSPVKHTQIYKEFI